MSNSTKLQLRKKRLLFYHKYLSIACRTSKTRLLQKHSCSSFHESNAWAYLKTQNINGRQRCVRSGNKECAEPEEWMMHMGQVIFENKIPIMRRLFSEIKFPYTTFDLFHFTPPLNSRLMKFTHHLIKLIMSIIKWVELFDDRSRIFYFILKDVNLNILFTCSHAYSSLRLRAITLWSKCGVYLI